MADPDSDRQSSILTDTQREFLILSDEERREKYSKQMVSYHRQKILERVRNALLDFSLLWEHWDADEREQVFGDADEPPQTIPDPDVRAGAVDTLALILRATGVMNLPEPNRFNPDAVEASRLLRMAIRKVGLRQNYLVRGVKLKINADLFPEPNMTRALEERQKLSGEALLYFLSREDVDTMEIQEQIREQILGDAED